jgi:hypothetical protein
LEDPFQAKAVPKTDFRYIVVPEANGIRSIPRENSIKLEFDLSGNPIPLWATDVYLQVIYRGKLGLEEGAVAVGFKDISEPTPVDIINGMDKICIEGVSYDAGSSGAIEAVDFDRDGDPEWDVYRHDLSNYCVLFSRVKGAETPPSVSPEKNHLKIERIGAGGYVRVFILTDSEFNLSYDADAVRVDERDDWPESVQGIVCRESGKSSPCGVRIVGVKNQVDYVGSAEECAKAGSEAPCFIPYFPPFREVRGRPTWEDIRVVNEEYPPGETCSE